MGHLVQLLFFIFILIYRHIWGHSSPVCEQLGFRCDDGSCISSLRACDGHPDCEDGSDEHQCSGVWCKDGEFACHSGQCISTALVCDGVYDCDNERDEVSCHNCTSGFFSCGASDACLLRIKLCDGQTDCRDGRDETWELCGSARPLPQTSPMCAASEFRCGTGECIRHAWRCDHSPDCSDGSDEENCDQDECQVNNGGCSHYCVDQKMGFLCRCPNNMKLVDDSQCEAVDVCLESDVCDQLCVHANGSLTCDCHEGYDTTPNTGECKVKGNEAQLFFTSSKGIRYVGLDKSEKKVLVADFPGPGPVAVVASNRSLYWAERGQNSIYRMFVHDQSQEAPALFLKVQGSVSGLAVDWIHKLLYWTSPESGSIHVALLDASSQHKLITGLDRPFAVAVESLLRFLFWTQTGSSPKIQRSSLNGGNVTDLVTSSIHFPVALCLDMPRQLLYWFDQGTRSISRVDLHGRYRKTVIESNGYLDRSFGLAVFEGNIFWSEEVTRSICRANKHNGGNFQVLQTNIPSPGAVAILQPALQPNGPSACERLGTVCRHGCAVDLLGNNLRFSCKSPPAVLSVITSPTLSDPMFAGILALIVFLSMLLLGTTLWWWREECSPPRSLNAQSFSLKESQDPLINHEPPTRSNNPGRPCVRKFWMLNKMTSRWSGQRTSVNICSELRADTPSS